jgi:hypothetical protein
MSKHRKHDPKLAAKVAADALREPDQSEHWWASWVSPYDSDAVWHLFQKLTCPVTCVGYVNGTGWHQECQKRARDAMRALDIEPPDIDPIPSRGEA